MAKVTSIVMKLDNGMYRSLDVARMRSAYVQGDPPSNATLHKNGRGGLASAETNEPAWDWPSDAQNLGGDGDDGEDNGNGPVCYWIDGVWICD